MLKPYEMTNVIITGPKKLQEKVIKELHKLKILHIVEHSKSDLADIGQPLEAANELSEILVKVRALITALNIKKEETPLGIKRGLLEIRSTIKKLNEKVTLLVEEERVVDDLISKSETLKKELEILKNVNIPLESFASYKSLEHFTGFLKNNAQVLNLKNELSKITQNFILLNSTGKRNCFIALFVDKKAKEQANTILQKNNFSPINFTSIGNLKGSAEINLKKIEAERIKTENSKAKIKEEFEKLSKEYKGFLLAADEFLSEQLEKAEAPLKFAATKDAFLIKGWVPTGQLNDTIESLNRTSKNKIFIHHEKAKSEDSVPVKLDNKGYAKPFEFFIDLYSLPKYKEIDPTFLMFLTYPIFFGFMLGDFGYGIVSFGLFWLLKKKLQKFSNFFNILLVSSASAILFGFVYGEFFGLEKIGHFHIPHLISRIHSMFELIYIAIAIGVLHINIGLVFGFINMLKAHGLKQAIFEKGSWFVLEIGIALLALSYFNKIVLSPWVGAVFLIIAVIMLYKGEGVKGIIEIPSILTNTLSYIRLMAIGLSSVSIAVVVNEISSGFFHKGGLLILAGILILLTGHILNIILGLFGSFLHSLRLHYVEFFSKFFQGGAEKYIPFGTKE